ncbi:YfhD family protein [Cohnella yongneupensis]|uniref:YfhD family protein n=1 Tax=Cohnella yongneupensis TaxID=425006 RepID=A0ABW0R9S9_9BACL
MSKRELSQGMTSSQLPIASDQDVEFADELADEEDQEAQERAAAANRRVLNEGV